MKYRFWLLKYNQNTIMMEYCKLKMRIINKIISVKKYQIKNTYNFKL